MQAGSYWWRLVGQQRKEGEDALLLLQSALRETHHCWIIYSSAEVTNTHCCSLNVFDLCEIEVTSRYYRCPGEKMGTPSTLALTAVWCDARYFSGTEVYLQTGILCCYYIQILYMDLVESDSDHPKTNPTHFNISHIIVNISSNFL